MSDKDTRTPEEREKEKLRHDAYDVTQRLQGQLRSQTRDLWPGLCGRCTHLELVVVASGVKHAKCGEFDRHLDQRDPVTECTGYWPRNHPTYAQLIEQARLISGAPAFRPGPNVYL